MPAATIPHVKPEDFEKIPETGSYVSTSKTRDYMGNVIANLTGYDEIRMAQKLGLYPTSLAEWGKSRKYFQDNPDKEFHGRIGKEIEVGYISEEAERVATFFAFRKDEEFSRDVHDLLNEAGFDGQIALIDFPWIEDKENIFIPSPRMRIVDVSGKIPLENGYVQDYDEDLEVVTLIGPAPNPKYHRAYFWIKPEGTRQLLRGFWHKYYCKSRRFVVDARWKPSKLFTHVTTRFSSNDDPSEFLAPKKTRIMAAKQETLELLEKISEKYCISLEELTQELKE